MKTDITFDLATTVYMNENARAGYNAITVTARDPNNNAVSRYEMINTATSSSNFEVKANGKLRFQDLFWISFFIALRFHMKDIHLGSTFIQARNDPKSLLYNKYPGLI